MSLYLAQHDVNKYWELGSVLYLAMISVAWNHPFAKTVIGFPAVIGKFDMLAVHDVWCVLWGYFSDILTGLKLIGAGPLSWSSRGVAKSMSSKAVDFWMIIDIINEAHILHHFTDLLQDWCK